jgi:hypothetical protein
MTMQLSEAVWREMRRVDREGVSGNWFCFLALVRKGLAEAWAQRVSETQEIIRCQLTDAGREALSQHEREHV